VSQVPASAAAAAAAESAGLTEQAARAGFRPLSLDGLNVLLADVRGALGPYLNVFLVHDRHWSQADVGWVTTIGGLIGLAFQTPIGALIDSTRRKRALIVAALAVLAAGGAAIFLRPTLWPVFTANTLMAIVGDVFGPAVAALTLGLYRRRMLARRLGRNAAFDHIGNVAIALALAGVGYAFSHRALFLTVPVFAALAAGCVLSIPGGAIDHARARGEAAEGGDGKPVSLWRVFADCRPLLVFGICCLLFHFANAPMLPLVGQKLAAAHPKLETALVSACIIAAQLVMLPIALAVGATADRIGRKPILLIGFGILPIRALLYTLSNDSVWLIAIQTMDGVGAGIYAVIAPLVIADLTRGTGRFNVAQGAIATMMGIGASLSGIVSGEIVDHAGYTAAFLACGAAALVALGTLIAAMPETAADRAKASSR
jgi:MFS family permease